MLQTIYAPIAIALCTLDIATKQILQKKVEIAYFICSLMKMPHYVNYRQNNMVYS